MGLNPPIQTNVATSTESPDGPSQPAVIQVRVFNPLDGSFQPKPSTQVQGQPAQQQAAKTVGDARGDESTGSSVAAKIPALPETPQMPRSKSPLNSDVSMSGSQWLKFHLILGVYFLVFHAMTSALPTSLNVLAFVWMAVGISVTAFKIQKNSSRHAAMSIQTMGAGGRFFVMALLWPVALEGETKGE